MPDEREEGFEGDTRKRQGDRETVGIWRAVAGGLQVGRPNLRSSAFEGQALAATASAVLIGSLHREAEVHSASSTSQDASTRPTLG